MMLRFIKENNCPVCGNSIVVKEEIEAERYGLELRQHTNGGQWEKRVFSCGQLIEYIPNYSKSEISSYSVCKNNERFRIEKENRKSAKEELMNFIDTLNVDKDYKSRLQSGHFYLD